MVKRTGAVVVVAADLWIATPAGAQETGTPVFSAPYRGFSSHELGLSLSAPKGSDLGVEGFYSFRLGPVATRRVHVASADGFRAAAGTHAMRSGCLASAADIRDGFSSLGRLHHVAGPCIG